MNGASSVWLVTFELCSQAQPRFLRRLRAVLRGPGENQYFQPDQHLALGRSSDHKILIVLLSAGLRAGPEREMPPPPPPRVTCEATQDNLSLK